MAAGVHHTRVGGGIGHASGFLDRQRVHVGAQAYGAVGRAAADRCDNAVTADAAGERDTQLRQLLLDERGGVLLVESEFGIGVQVMPPLGQPVMQGLVHPGSISRET